VRKFIYSLAVWARPHAPAGLGGQCYGLPVAALPHPAADDLLRDAARIAGVPARVDIGGVEEGAASFGKRVHHGERRRFISGPAELHGAKAERRNLQAGAAQAPVVHSSLFFHLQDLRSHHPKVFLRLR
jgi:hypothetical protein